MPKSLQLIAPIFTLFILLLFSQQAQGQFDYMRLGGGLDFGYAGGSGELNTEGSYGFAFNSHIYYAPNDRVKWGLEWNRGGIFSEVTDSTSTNYNLWILTNVSPKIWYSFTTARVQPYVALAAGVNRTREPNTEDAAGSTILGERRWGFNIQPEIGVQVMGLYLAYRYNYGPRTPKSPKDNIAQANISASNYHVVLGARYTIGGFDQD